MHLLVTAPGRRRRASEHRSHQDPRRRWSRLAFPAGHRDTLSGFSEQGRRPAFARARESDCGEKAQRREAHRHQVSWPCPASPCWPSPGWSSPSGWAAPSIAAVSRAQASVGGRIDEGCTYSCRVRPKPMLRCAVARHRDPGHCLPVQLEASVRHRGRAVLLSRVARTGRTGRADRIDRIERDKISARFLLRQRSSSSRLEES
jgi:hypothetical protein